MRNNGYAHSINFPPSRPYFGKLATKTVVYTDKRKVAQLIGESIYNDVITNFHGFRKSDGGKTANKSSLTRVLTNVFLGDRTMSESIMKVIKRLELPDKYNLTDKYSDFKIKREFHRKLD